jgi:hypothetical protein
MAPKDWDNDDDRRPDPHDSALSVGTNNLGDTTKMRELEEELHNMTDKVASACTLASHSHTTYHSMYTDGLHSTALRRLRERHPRPDRRTTLSEKAQRLRRQHSDHRKRQNSSGGSNAHRRPLALRQLHALAQSLCSRSHSCVTRARTGIAACAIAGAALSCRGQSRPDER